MSPVEASASVFVVGVCIGAVFGIACRRPILCALTLLLIGTLLAWTTIPHGCTNIDCSLDHALDTCVGALNWWTRKPLLTLGASIGFALCALLPRKRSPSCNDRSI